MVVLLVACANAGFVGSLGIPLVPLVQDEYGLSLGEAQWTATIALLVGAVATPVLGRLSDGRGGRQFIWLALGLMTLGAGLSIIPGDFTLMITGRALQGVGMALAPLAITVARHALPEAAFARAVGYLAVAAVTGAGIAFPVSTWIASNHGLHASFLFAAALAGATLLAAVIVLPPTGTDRPETGSIDLVGALLLSATVILLMLLITRPNQPLPTAITVALLTAATAVALVLWVNRRDDPFVDLRTQLRAENRGVNIIGMLVGVGAYAALTLVSLRVQAPVSTGYGLGHSAFIAGSMIVPFSLTSIAGSRLSPYLRPRIGGIAVLVVGAAMTSLGLLALSIPLHSLLVFGAVMCIVGVGAGLTFASTPAVISERVAPAAMGSALSFNQLLRYLGFSAGGALAVAVLELASRDPTGFPDQNAHIWAALACAAVPAVSFIFLRRARSGS